MLRQEQQTKWFGTNAMAPARPARVLEGSGRKEIRKAKRRITRERRDGGVHEVLVGRELSRGVADVVIRSSQWLSRGRVMLVVIVASVESSVDIVQCRRNEWGR